MSHWMLWVELLPKPERNGMKGAILMTSFLWFVLTPLPSGTEGSAIGSVMCEIMPWKCLETSSVVGNLRPYHEWRLISNIHFGAPRMRGVSECSCHADILYPDGVLEHGVFEQSIACESVYRDLPERTEWQGNPAIVQFRYHCTDDPRYSKPGWIVDRPSKH